MTSISSAAAAARVRPPWRAISPHVAALSRSQAPWLHDFLAMDFDQRWVHRSPRAMLDTFGWFRGEGFGLIVEDLRRMGRERGVIAEGFRLLPGLVAPLLADTSHAVWLLATPQFRRQAFQARDGLWTVAGNTSDPERALRNLLERDALFTDRLRRDISQTRLPAIEVDFPMTEDQVAQVVAEGFGFPDTTGPQRGRFGA